MPEPDSDTKGTVHLSPNNKKTKQNTYYDHPEMILLSSNYSGKIIGTLQIKLCINKQ